MLDIRPTEVLPGEPCMSCELLVFETLLSDISARFISMPADQIDSEIEHAQTRICDCLKIDHSALWTNTPDEPHVFRLTHVFRDPSLIAPPERMDAEVYFPWSKRKILAKEVVCFERTGDLPSEAAIDVRHWEMYGVRSLVAFPLSIGDGPVTGALSFDATTSERTWPEPLVHRLQLLAEVFANALARRRFEQVLRDSEERLRLAAAAANVGLWTIDMSIRHLWSTEKAKEIFGVEPCLEFTFERFMSMIHPDDTEAVQAVLDDAQKTGQERALEYRILRPCGDMRWISSRGRLQSGESGSPGRLMGVCLDITDRRRSEESRARHSAIVRSSEDAIIAKDLKGIIADWNAAAEKIYGYTHDEAVGQSILFVVPPERQNEVTEILARIQAGESIQHFETERVRKDGTRFNASLTVSPIRDLNGRIVGASTIARDITQEKRVQENLQRSFAEVKDLKEKLKAESEYLQDEVRSVGRYEEIIGQSEALRQVFRKVEQVAATDSVVLITGESGTGKELVARAIHDRSRRSERVMVKVDCSSLPASLIESELFGREKGAYTGALTRQMGRVETADRSTLFLDEIGDLDIELQAKLLRIVQEGKFERLGSATTSHVNVRLIAATHRNLEERVKAGKFREDLFYRLNVFPIHIPPLRERLDDIPLLVAAFVREFEKKMDKKISKVPVRIIDELKRYPWPGNIRELRNIVERAVIVTPGEKLNLEVPRVSGPVNTRTLKQAEQQQIVAVLEQTGWRVKGRNGAAAILGMNPSTLYTTMRRLHIPTRHEKSGGPSDTPPSLMN